jgi:glycosyltransferase involved in cell wall biosynthesis
MSKRILIDGQVLQTGARYRGMGHYTICLISALLRKSQKVEMILSKNLPFDSKNRSELGKLLPGVTFRSLDLWTTEDHPIERAFEHNEQVLNRYINSLSASQEVDYFVPSLFQEPTVAVFPEGVHLKALLFHDLVPYLYYQRYRKVMRWENYLKRFKVLFQAELIFTNSQSVADDLHVYLGIPKRRLCAIDGASIHTDTSVSKPKQLNLDKPFILFNTSDDPRKNNLRGVIGFEEYRAAADLDCKLVLTSAIEEKEQEYLKRFSGKLVFTGNIPEAQLNWLYQNCEIVLFPTEAEGLGLPALEAVDARKKVVCSAIPVLQEINPEKDAFFYCDHENVHSISTAIKEAMSPSAKINEKAYNSIRRRYTWDKSAERMIKGLQNAHQSAKPPKTRKKLAIFSAAPSGLSGIGVTSAALHPVLAEYFEIDYYIERGLSGAEIRPDYLKYVATCYPAEIFGAQRYKDYDAVIYHLGNGDYHMQSIQNALYLPGYIIVHDTHLREAYRVLRQAGLMHESRVELEEAIDKANHTKRSSYFSSIANRQLGIITHSNYAAQAMEEVLDVPVPVKKIHLPTNVPDLAPARKSEKVTVGLAGAIAGVKGLDVIESIAQNPRFYDWDIRLFGYRHIPQQKIDELCSYDNVTVSTDISDIEFQNTFRNLDIFVNYRLAYNGETSNTTLEAMRYGVVAIVRDIGWYAELPNDVVVKVKTPEDVLTALEQLANDPKKRQAIGKKARDYVAAEFSQEKYVQSLQLLLEDSHPSNPNTKVAKRLRQEDIRSASKLLKTYREEV